MARLQRSGFVGFGIAFGVGVGVVGAGCGGESAPEPVGDCVEIEPFPGYVTCVLNAPQGEGGAAPGGAAARAAVIDDDLPPAIELVRPLVDAGCVSVHNQGRTGWCTLNATTAALEAATCAGGGAAGRLSEPHLRYEWNQHRDFAAADITVGMWIADAMAVADSVYLAGEEIWPAATTGTPSEMAAAMNANRPIDDVLACTGRSRASGDVAVAAGDVDGVRRALAAGHPVVMSFTQYQATGWIAPADGFPAEGTTIVVADPLPANGCRCSCEAGEANCTVCPATEAHCTIGWHTVLLTGYDDATRRFTFVNSWSTGWSKGGFATMSYDYLRTSSQRGSYLVGLAPPAPACPPTDSCDGVDGFYDRFLGWECGMIAACCDGADLPDDFDCLPQISAAMAPMITAMNAAIDNGTLGYDCSAIDGCIGEFEAMTCDDFSRLWGSGVIPSPTTSACLPLLVPKVADGGACTIDVECTSRRCGVTTFGEPGTCRRAPVAGESCRDGAVFIACADGLYCAGANQICTPRGDNGAACGASYECNSGYCDCPPGGCPLPAAGTCAEPVACDGE